VISINIEDGDIDHLLWCLEAGTGIASFTLRASAATEGERELARLRMAAISRLHEARMSAIVKKDNHE
jgi:hypothetical protein